jgi:type IV secretory pathway VirB2 component (pilin)
VTDVWLGVIAAAVVVMALIQVGAIVAGARLARRMNVLTAQVEREIKPLIANLTSMSAEAARAASLAASQVERVEHLVGDLGRRAEDTMDTVQRFVQGPARNGVAIVAGVRAAFNALRGIRDASLRRRPPARGTAEDEDSLFIG